ncbi:TRAP transporter small permease [Halomonas sp. MCCC 1A11036]|uniref:TRAP transporter small permease protein n=1 Tax=Billgrantia zhangzhouensis TaxID=2733481 RepID=A0ABS9AFN1_9GAMM|nr:TRAP transporter small permease [Halomonas zhangzhouensis]MCE8020527.1 TRAP transporter small permease [Halomonas zhangzhouensis]
MVNAFLFRLYALCGVVSGLCIVLIALVVLLRVVSRILGYYVPGLTEITGYLMAASGGFGMAYAFHKNSHIRVSMVIDRLGEKGHALLNLACLAMACLIVGYLASYLIDMTRVSYRFDDISSGDDRIKLWMPQSLVACGFAAFFVCLCHYLVMTLAEAVHVVSRRNGEGL